MNMGFRSTVAWALAADAGPGVSTLPITDEFRSQIEDFDWKTIPETAACIIHPANELTGITTYSYSSPSGQSIVFTDEGFWYDNKRWPRRYPSLAKDWPAAQPSFEPDHPPHPVHYFYGMELNIICHKVILFGKSVKVNRKINTYHALDHNGFITRLTGFPADLSAELRDQIPWKYVQSFRTKKGFERIVETGLGKDGRTFVLVNETIEREMDDLDGWLENESMLRLERQDRKILPVLDDTKSLVYNVARSRRDIEVQNKRIAGWMGQIIEEFVETPPDPLVTGKIDTMKVTQELVGVDEED